MDEEIKQLLIDAKEATEPQYKDNGDRRDTYECGGCGRSEYTAYPPHNGTCDQWCGGYHTQREIKHREDCIYIRLRNKLDKL